MENHMTQEELREIYKNRLIKEKQKYIAQQTNIAPSILSMFKSGKIDLYPYLFEKLEDYLLKTGG